MFSTFQSAQQQAIVLWSIARPTLMLVAVLLQRAAARPE
jgi:hypothetical protein